MKRLCRYQTDKIKFSVSKTVRRISTFARNAISRSRISSTCNPTLDRERLRFGDDFFVVAPDCELSGRGAGRGRGGGGAEPVVTGLIVVPSLITALDGTDIVWQFVIRTRRLLRSRAHLLHRRSPDLAAGNYECRYHCPCSIRPFIPLAAQCKSSRGAAWNMHRSPLIIMQPDNARVRTRACISISLLLKIKPTGARPPSSVVFLVLHHIYRLYLFAFRAKVRLIVTLIRFSSRILRSRMIRLLLNLYLLCTFFCALIYPFKLLLRTRYTPKLSTCSILCTFLFLSVTLLYIPFIFLLFYMQILFLLIYFYILAFCIFLLWTDSLLLLAVTILSCLSTLLNVFFSHFLYFPIFSIF